MDESRVRIFVDFWNFQLTWNAFHGKKGTGGIVRIPWEEVLPKIVIERTKFRISFKKFYTKRVSHCMPINCKRS